MALDPTQEQHELTVGDAFIRWYNEHEGTEFTYASRGANPPDLVYRSKSKEMLLEITVAYYDPANATILWKNARDLPDAADSWMSKNPDQKLIDSIDAALTKKCNKRYPANCVLVVNLYPAITAAEELDALIHQIKVPVGHPFVGIYLTGIFPISSNSSGGYHCWKLA
jgi:hypothetical protein